MEVLLITHDQAEVACARIACGRAGVDSLDHPGPGFTPTGARRLP